MRLSVIRCCKQTLKISTEFYKVTINAPVIKKKNFKVNVPKVGH